MALALWAAIVGVEVVKGGRWAWSLPYILLSTPIAIIATLLLCRSCSASKKPMTYGTLLIGPFGSALLVLVCYRLCCDGWRVLTAHYWLDSKGGWFGVLVDLALVGGVSVLPAMVVVAYSAMRCPAPEALGKGSGGG